MAEKTRRLTAVVLAAGQGTRMKSPLPKVLHPVAGTPILVRVIQALREVGATEIRIVVGHQENLVRQVVEPLGVSCFRQTEQKGTAHAVLSAQIDDIDGDVLILNGDHPLLTGKNLTPFVEEFRSGKASLALATCELTEPGHYGRIVRQKSEVRAIVEAKDASADTLAIREVNTGIYLVRAELLKKLLPQIRNQNAQGEYYLTDLVELAATVPGQVLGLKVPDELGWGVNTQAELAEASRRVFQRKRDALMASGVLFIDPLNTYVEDSVQVGEATVLYPGVFLKGRTRLGRFVVVEPHCMIMDSEIGDSVEIKAGSYIERSRVHTKATLGPYARLRPETEIGEEAHVGNFVEMKKVRFGARSKAGHLAYLGDADVGTDTNIGCGTITCNYAVDRKKYKTEIGNHVFVGSDSQFIAPVRIGDGAVIGSGSTITKDVPDKALAVARSRQIVKENYSPVKKPKTSET